MIVPDDESEDTLRTLTYRCMKTKENTRVYGNIHFNLFSKKILIYSFFFLTEKLNLMEIYVLVYFSTK